MEFRILGPLEVTDGDVAISIDAPKHRVVLGVLLLHPNEVVSTERLIDELWGERPPPTAGKVLQTYVSQLRKAVGADRIATHAPGYLLRLDEDALDAMRFRDLAREGRTLAASGDTAEADRRYREALGLWRGAPLADVVFESFARNEVERLEEERIAALMDRIDCDLSVGAHEALVPELEALVPHYPLRERLRAQLMLALYRAGRQADALESYQNARRTLVEDLGVEPGPALQRLQSAILRQEPSLGLEEHLRPMTRLESTLRGTVTVVVIEGRRLLGLHRAMTPDSFGALLIEYRSLLSGLLERAGGHGVEGDDDTVAASFATPIEAVRAAVSAQRAVAAHDWPEARRIEVTIGLHSGDAGIGWVGPAGALCTQLCDAAEAGEIFISQATAALLEDAQLGDLRVHDRGVQRTRRTGQSVRAYEVDFSVG